jgi:hypothetical protein
MKSQMTVPSAFAQDYDGEIDHHIAKPTFHIPPSPSASSILSNAISRNPFSSNLHCRKRARVEACESNATTPRGFRRNDALSPTDAFDIPSPAPLVNMDYRIAGGIDISTSEQLRYEDQDLAEFRQDLRPNRHIPSADQLQNGYFPYTPTDTALSTKRRFSAPTQQSHGWGQAVSSTVWALTGGVAGKVFNFCWNTAFRGFHAGDGQGYDMQIDSPTVTAHHNMQFKGSQDVFHAEYRGRGSTPIPGGFPADSLIEDSWSWPQSYRQQDTPTQVDETGQRSSLKSNWVMVDDPYTDIDPSPARKKARRSTATTTQARPMSSASPASGTRPRLQPRVSATGASYASPRGTSFHSNHSRPQSSEGFQRQHKRSRSSFTQTRQSDVSSAGSKSRSPDVVKFEKKIRRKDQKQDESIWRLNQQMQDMIKEAQQALGSKVEVMDEVDDEGYGEGLDTSVVSRW